MPRETVKQKRTKIFNELCHRHRLALSQATRAREKGYNKIADGVLEQAKAIQVRIEQHVREDLGRSLLKQRSQKVQMLHAALSRGATKEARQLSRDLAELDKQLEAT